ncbi:MAG: hypothetical protein JWN43_4214 [Gammaproteobacteria bacterium]|nr:hypothetical protein [Gammaproteobacteria bacterium]
MATKRVSPGEKKVTRKSKAGAAPELTDSAVIAVLESETAVSPAVNPDVRRQLVAAEAYFLAERRGFAAGHEVDDWVAAEAMVESRLQHMQVA